VSEYSLTPHQTQYRSFRRRKEREGRKGKEREGGIGGLLLWHGVGRRGKEKREKEQGREEEGKGETCPTNKKSLPRSYNIFNIFL